MAERKGGTKKWYGVRFKIGEYDGIEIQCMLERGLGDLYFGIKAIDSKTQKEADKDGDENHKAFLKEMYEKIKDLCEEENNHAWAGRKYLEPRIDFESFSDENTLKLCKEEGREKAIEVYWAQMEEFIEGCREALDII